jgi:hypothetical protein
MRPRVATTHIKIIRINALMSTGPRSSVPVTFLFTKLNPQACISINVALLDTARGSNKRGYV